MPSAPSVGDMAVEGRAALPPLLVVDDDETIRQQMKWALCPEYRVLLAEDRKSALDLFRREMPHVVTLDLGLHPHPRDATEGLLTLTELLQTDPRVKVVVVSGNANRANALEAIQRGAYDFFTKPVETQEVRILLRRAYALFDLEEENRQARGSLGQIGGLMGTSPVMQAVHAAIRKVASTDVPVLITGESGTGKELAARAIHAHSLRADGPFVAIHCGAIPENLLESELFGHEKGAFTGAHIQRRGRIEYAEGGTLFLDEIGEMSPGLQVKLLRFLQEKTLERVGGRETLQIDARVVAATHRNLQERVAQGTFREDLLFRLSVISIVLPPLRERGSDLFLLAQMLITRLAREAGKKVHGLTAQAIDAINHHAWQGNVREMENKIRRGIVMAEGRLLTPADIDLVEVAGAMPPILNLKTARNQMERKMVELAMSRCGNNLAQAATALGISRQTLYSILLKHGIRSPGPSTQEGPHKVDPIV